MKKKLSLLLPVLLLGMGVSCLIFFGWPKGRKTGTGERQREVRVDEKYLEVKDNYQKFMAHSSRKGEKAGLSLSRVYGIQGKKKSPVALEREQWWSQKIMELKSRFKKEDPRVVFRSLQSTKKQ